MRDAMTSDSAVFEPEEIKILDAALKEATKRLGVKVSGTEDRRSELAKLVHNLGRSRLQLKKPLRSAADANNLADEATEVFSYIMEAPEALLVESRRQGAVKQRDITIFPTELRMPPKTALPSH